MMRRRDLIILFASSAWTQASRAETAVCTEN
jgi:hypothetical protein